jgi:hypothetical protein
MTRSKPLTVADAIRLLSALAPDLPLYAASADEPHRGAPVASVGAAEAARLGLDPDGIGPRVAVLWLAGGGERAGQPPSTQ